MNFTFKDILIVVLLLAIIGIVIMHMKTSNKLLTAVAVKTGAVELSDKTEVKSKVLKSARSNDQGDEEEEDKKPVKLNAVQKKVVTLFEDGIPKTTTELKKLYKTHYSEIDDVKLNNTIWNLKAAEVILSEKIDNKNYWGLIDWFEDDADLFLEEYADKIPGVKEAETKV